MKRIILLLSLLMLASCAQVHNKYRSNVVLDSMHVNGKEKGLIFSAEINSDLCSKYFGYIEIAIENNSQEWVDIDNIKLRFDNKNTEKNSFLTLGNDFIIWKKGMLLKKSIHDYNKKLVLGMISLGGAVLASTSDDEKLSKGGAALTVTSLSVMGLDDYYENKANKYERAGIFPENHLLYEKIRIPPGFFVRKFILLQTKNENIDEYLSYINLDFLENGKKKSVKLKFRESIENSSSSDSDWMSFNHKVEKTKTDLKLDNVKTTNPQMNKSNMRVSIIRNIRQSDFSVYKKLENYIKENYPEEYRKSLVGIK